MSSTTKTSIIGMPVSCSIPKAYSEQLFMYYQNCVMSLMQCRRMRGSCELALVAGDEAVSGYLSCIEITLGNRADGNVNRFRGFFTPKGDNGGFEYMGMKGIYPMHFDITPYRTGFKPSGFTLLWHPDRHMELCESLGLVV